MLSQMKAPSCEPISQPGGETFVMLGWGGSENNDGKWECSFWSLFTFKNKTFASGELILITPAQVHMPCKSIHTLCTFACFCHFTNILRYNYFGVYVTQHKQEVEGKGTLQMFSLWFKLVKIQIGHKINQVQLTAYMCTYILKSCPWFSIECKSILWLDYCNTWMCFDLSHN